MLRADPNDCTALLRRAVAAATLGRALDAERDAARLAELAHSGDAKPPPALRRALAAMRCAGASDAGDADVGSGGACKAAGEEPEEAGCNGPATS